MAKPPPKVTDTEHHPMEFIEKPNQALRYNAGKSQWSLIDFDSLLPLVQGMEYGAEKYARDNWKKGLDENKIMESLLRHAFAILRGEVIDPESGVPHIGLLMCNAMFVSYFQRLQGKHDVKEITDEVKI